MTQPGYGAGFASESLGKRRIAPNFRRKDLYHDEAIQTRLSSLVDGSHPAFAHKFQDFKLRKQLAEQVDR